MEHAEALLTWICTNLIESKCASGQAFPVTSEQPDPGEKSPPKQRQAPCRNGWRSGVQSPDIQETACWQRTSHKTRGWKGAGPGQRRPALRAPPGTRCRGGWQTPRNGLPWFMRPGTGAPAGLGGCGGRRGHAAAVGGSRPPWTESRSLLAGDHH